MSKKVLVLATSFLDSLISHPVKEGRAKKMLDRLVRGIRYFAEILLAHTKIARMSIVFHALG